MAPRTAPPPSTEDLELQLVYGMESLVTELGHESLNIKLADLKPESYALLAGMLLGYSSRARQLLGDMGRLNQVRSKRGKG